MNFVGNIVQHLQKGLMGWLFGAMAEAGIQLPESFDLKGILTLILQVLGMTYNFIRARAVKLFGEKVVKALETGAEIFQVLISKGIAGLWEYIKEQVSSLADAVIDGIKSFVSESIIKAGITWIIGLLNPAGAFIKACKAIYDIIIFFVERGSQILALVNAVLDSVTAIANGAIGVAASAVENALSKAVPVVISFLAALLGVGGISEKIRSIITKIQEPIGKAIDWVIGKAYNLVKAAGKLLGFGKSQEGKEIKPDERTEAQKQADLNKALSDADKIMKEKDATTESVEAKFPSIKSTYKLTSINLVRESDSKYRVVAKVNPEGYTPSEELGAEVVDHVHKNGKITPCVQKGSVRIPIDRVNIFCMGKVAMYPKEELRQLQELKQNDRKKFDSNPENEKRLVLIRDGLKHNYERSQEMFESIEKVGWGDSVEVIDTIIGHLLSVGEGVTVETSVEHPSKLDAPLGGLKVQSTWKILPDGTKFLTTIRFIPTSK
jgi:hypothetical protein